MGERRVCGCILALLALLLAAGCTSRAVPVVVVYTSVDQPYSEPILKEFEARSGIRVQAIYDTEASKTTGLVSRLVAEKARPQADVFWSSEIAQTLWLKDRGLLASYSSPAAAGILPDYRDPDGYWTGFGLRARVILVNTERVAPEHYPSSIHDLLDPRWAPGDVGLANPLFGTTATHAAALYIAWGAEDARSYFQALHSRGARMVDGNSVVRDMVASGELAVGLTDTDDAYGAVRAGKPVALILPDQDSFGTLLIPNTVALVAGGPHPREGQALIDFLLGPEVEQSLHKAGFFVGSVRGEEDSSLVGIKFLWKEVSSVLEQVKTEMQEIWLR